MDGVRRSTWSGPPGLLLGCLLVAGCATESAGEGGSLTAALTEAPGHPITARGAFTCDFGLPGDVPIAQVPAIIERDRMYMAAQPGIVNKHLPIAFDFATGNLFSGGRYLFDTREHARAYDEFVHEGFVLDGVQFLDRPMFLDADCRDWDVIGAHDFTPIETTHIVMRSERWSVPSGNQRGMLHRAWHELVLEAGERGLAGVWLLYDDEEDLAQIVYYADRVGPSDPSAPDFASLGALASAPALGAELDANRGWEKTFDRTHWVFTVWFPFEAGDQGVASLWPNSPPFPAPFCSDSVCEVSQGEDHDTCPADCAPGCGDAVCQGDESSASCPGDCRLE